jgi:hypothetical protein
MYSVSVDLPTPGKIQLKESKSQEQLLRQLYYQILLLKFNILKTLQPKYLANLKISDENSVSCFKADFFTNTWVFSSTKPFHTPQTGHLPSH